MPYTEFYVHPQGSNLNAGSTSGVIPFASGQNGVWDATHRLFLGPPGCLAGAVSGMYASVHSGVQTVATTHIGEIVQVFGAGADTSGVKLSTVSVNGHNPASNGVGMICRIGGAWAGPNGAVGFPINWASTNLANPLNYPVRINFQNSSPYTISAAITTTTAGTRGGVLLYEGYSNDVADSGRAILQGPQTGTSFVLLTSQTMGIRWKNLHFRWNGNSGSASMVTTAGQATFFERCVFSDSYRFMNFASTSYLQDCEFYNCNLNNNSNGVLALSNCNLERCIIHNCSGNNSHALVNMGGPVTIKDCQIYRVGGHGLFFSTNNGIMKITNTDFYKVNGDGIRFNTSSRQNQLSMENCNFVALSGVLGNDPNAGNNLVSLTNIGIHSTDATIIGSEAGWTSGNILYYANNPFTDADNGDFRLSTEAANQGVYTFRGQHTSVNPVGYLDIGSVQKLQSGGETVYVPSGIPGRVAINRNRIIGGY